MKYRLMVSLVGIPGLLLLIWLGGWPYFALITAITIIGLTEYFRLLSGDGLATRVLPVYAAALLLLVSAANEIGLVTVSWMPTYMQSAVLLLLALILILQTWDVAMSPSRSWLGMGAHLAGYIWIAGFMSTFILIRSYSFNSDAMTQIDSGFRLTLALFVSVWVCDSAAYFFGKYFGKTKIAPKVSPNKTVVGTTAGLAGAVITMQMFGLQGWLPGLRGGDYLVLGIITGGFGQLGDFVESRFKRDMGAKDSGTFLPGHGGILDRFDSLLYVMPITAVYIQLFLPGG